METTVSPIETVDGLIDALGGTAAVSRLRNVTMQAVSNWRAEGFIPERHHYGLWRECETRGLTVSEKLFGGAAA